MSAVKVPLERLSADALHAIIVEFVTRDGTELSETDSKVREVTALLDSGRAEIWFERSSGTCSIHAVP